MSPGDRIAEHFFSVQNDLGEGPRWHTEQQKLYWVDIERGQIHSLEWRSKAHQIHEIGVAVGCLAFRQSGGLVLATADGFCYWSAREGIAPIIDPRQGDGEGRFNDGAIDRKGRFWAGTMTPQGAVNSLYRLSPSGRVERMEQGIGISNGMGWSPEGDVFYFTDSPAKTIYAYDFDPSDGRISNKRMWVHTPDEPGVPDGLAVDQDGCVWSARWDGWKIDRYDPDGNRLQEVRLPCQRPTSCTFGGEDLNTLIITSARVDLDDEALKEQPLAGDLFCYDAGIKGVGETFFAG
jgi:sugar lactone lactonase YvrE